MPYEWRIDHDARTIRVRGFGDGATADTLGLIARLQDSLRECAGYDFLYDSRDLRIESSPADMMRVADGLFGETGAKFRRFAIVVPPARVALARIFAALADPYGVTANVFADVETAQEWLSAHPEQRHYPRMPAPRDGAADASSSSDGDADGSSGPTPQSPSVEPEP